MFTYTAEPGTPSEDGLKLLASWAATQDVAGSAADMGDSAIQPQRADGSPGCPQAPS